MAKEVDVQNNIKELGFSPQEGMGIVVSYTSKDLSGKIRDLFNFSTENYILQLCEKEIILLPVTANWLALTTTNSYKVTKDTELVIPFTLIEAIEIKESLLNYDIKLVVADSEIHLTTQQKGLNVFRKSSTITTKGGLNLDGDNWHAENLDRTLTAIKKLK